MDLRSLKYFLRIADLHSITRAARSLNVAQPSLTRQLHSLEDEFKCALFVRLSRGVALTEAGELLYEHATRLLEDVGRMQAALLELGGRPAGQIRLGLPPTLGPMVLPKLVALLRDRHPKVVLDVVPSRNLTLADWLMAGKVDVAILAQAPLMPEITVVGTAREEMVLLTGPRARRPGVVDLAELATVPLVGTSSLLAIASDLLKEHGVKMQIQQTLNNLDAVREMVRRSMCASIFPYGFIGGDYARGLVDAHRVTALGIHRRLDIAISPDRPKTGAMDVVIQGLQSIVDELVRSNHFSLASRAQARRRDSLSQTEH